MKKNLFVFLFLFPLVSWAVLPIGAQRNPVYTDNTGAGNILNTPLSSSNQISIIPLPSSGYHIVRYADFTNALISPTFATGIVTNSLIVGEALTAGNNASSGIAVGTHFLQVSNPGNPSVVLRNFDPSGSAAFLLKNSAGTDAGQMGTANNGTNILIFSYMTAGSYIRLTTSGGASDNEMYIRPGITTNAGPFWANSVNSTNYQVNGVRGLTLSVTNLGPVLGSSNVMVYSEGILTNKFTIP